ncbi:MAG: peptidoglycan DD-metalloendopeptidase family protein [Chloroflexi bacterium]|nr:peptidoglycan DD-metalloendopeptidase family protein [Chloroflexota bacterium]
MNYYRIVYFNLYLFLLLGCGGAVATAVPSTQTSFPTMTVSATATGVPSPTSTPTNTSSPVPTNLPPPSITPQPTDTSSPTPNPSSTTEIVDRTCPNPPLVKPDYLHGYLAAQPWPTPAAPALSGAEAAVSPPNFPFIDPLADGRKPIAQAYYPYGWDGDGRFLLHNGADMPELLGTAVLAVADGTVVVAQSDAEELYGWRCDWYGQLVVLQLDDLWQGEPVYVLYGHIRNIQVEPGQRVEQGETVAEIGIEGVSTVPHLHLEIRIANNSFTNTHNPMLWLQPVAESGVLGGRLVDPEGRSWQGIRVTLIDSSGEEAQFISTFTYLDDPQHMINPDAAVAENFVFADMVPGNYTLHVRVQGVDYRQPVQIRTGELTIAEIITAPYQTPTPNSGD